jgi:hypothetical protein
MGVWMVGSRNKKLNKNQMALTITDKQNQITFCSLDENEKMEIEVENHYKEYITVFLNKEDLISLRKHLDDVIDLIPTK